MSALKRQKLAAETQEERATRLALRRERLAAETHEERAAKPHIFGLRSPQLC